MTLLAEQEAPSAGWLAGHTGLHGPEPSGCPHAPSGPLSEEPPELEAESAAWSPFVFPPHPTVMIAARTATQRHVARERRQTGPEGGVAFSV